METWAVAITLFFDHGSAGQYPGVFVRVEKRPRVQTVESSSSGVTDRLVIMLGFLFSGPALLEALSLSREAVSIGGGLVLMIIAIRMIFPSRGGVMGADEDDSEPLVVPLAVPMIAGPSVLATLVLIVETDPNREIDWLMALGAAWFASAVILMCSNFSLSSARRSGP